MANPNNKKQPPPDGGAWATPHDWAAYREIITALYEGQNMTLKKIMQTMETKHNFFATERMYKSRLKQWGLRKNYRYEEVNEIIRQQGHRPAVPRTAPPAASAGGVVGARVRKTTRPRPHRRMPDPIDTKGGGSTSAGSALAPWGPPAAIARLFTPSPSTSPVELSFRPPSPSRQPSLSILFPLSPPADLRASEEAGFYIQHYLAGAFDLGMWDLHEPEWLNNNRNVVDWFNRVALARGTLSGGHTKHGFRLLQQSFDSYRSLLEAQDPRLMLYTCVAMFLLTEYPAIVKMLLRYIAELSRILQGPGHPLYRIWAQLDQMGMQKMLENAAHLFDCQISEFERYLPIGNLFRQSVTVFATRNLAVARLIDTDAALVRLGRVGPEGDNGRISMALAQVYCMGKRYDEARAKINELLDSNPERDRTKAGAYDTLFLIARMEGDKEQVREASTRRIGFCLKTFGPDNEWTIDACTDYETFLREVGDTAAADKVFGDFGIQMDKLAAGVNELVIST